jgi:hypothetical protein
MSVDFEFFPKLPPADPTGQVVMVRQTDTALWGFIVGRGAGARRIFFHSDDCLEVPQIDDLVQFKLAPTQRRGGSPRARDVRILARMETPK